MDECRWLQHEFLISERTASGFSFSSLYSHPAQSRLTQGGVALVHLRMVSGTAGQKSRECLQPEQAALYMGGHLALLLPHLHQAYLRQGNAPYILHIHTKR